MRTKKINLQKQILRIKNKLKVKYLSLSIAKQITLIWAIIWIISLFLPWIIVREKDTIIWNSFNSISWNIWYILFLVFILIFFLILSNSYKEKLKLYSNIDFKNHFIVVILWLLAVILSIVALSFAVWLSIVWQYISYGNGPIFCIISGILIFIWWIFIRADYKKNNSEIILEEMSKNREERKNKENMELPF